MNKKIIVSLMIFVFMLIVDIVCDIWSKMSIVLLALLACNLVTKVMIRYVELKRFDRDNENKIVDSVQGEDEQNLHNPDGESDNKVAENN